MCQEIPDVVSEALLESLRQTVKSEIFKQRESRQLFLPTCCNLTKKYLSQSPKFLQLVSSLIGDMLTFFNLERRKSSEAISNSDVHALVDEMLLPMVETILQTEDEDRYIQAKVQLFNF